MTKDVIIDSRIGKKVRGIERHGSFRDSTIPGLATWVIQKLKTDVQKEDQDLTKSINGKSGRDKENRSRGSSSPRRDSSSLRDDVKRDDRSASAKFTSSTRQDTRAIKGKAPATSNGSGTVLNRSNSASHLLNLMSTSSFTMFCFMNYFVLTREFRFDLDRLS